MATLTWGKTQKKFPQTIFLPRAKGGAPPAGQGTGTQPMTTTGYVPPPRSVPVFPGFTRNDIPGAPSMPPEVEFGGADFRSIKPADYNIIDPQQFADTFGDFNLSRMQKNFGQAKDFALDTLSTELQGLRAFAPASAALKREQTSLDNQFNQWQRSQQVRSVLPNAEADLEAQRRRALTYASGRAPDSITDRGLELGVRSRAADRAGYAGFGSRSAQAENVSDLMSADQRLQLAQYGEQLLSANRGENANLFLAPTEYSNAGEGIQIMPEVGAGRLTAQEQTAIDSATLLAPATALTSRINQEQFGTNLVQRTREFNAQGQFEASKFNAAGEFQASLANLEAGMNYENAVAGAELGQQNQALALGLAGIQGDAFNSSLQQTQTSDAIQTIIGSTAQIPAAIEAIGGVIDSITGKTQEPKKVSLTGEGESATAAAPAAPSTFSLSDSSGPAAIKFAEGAPTPAGYTPVAKNLDGTTSAVSIKDYEAELAQFAQASGNKFPALKIENAALADRAVSRSAGLSYLPLPGFQQVALTGTGRPVYSSVAAANSADTSALSGGARSLGVLLATLGVGDAGTLRELQAIDSVNSPSLIPEIDALANEGAAPASIAQAIQTAYLGGAPDGSDIGQQIAFQTHRIAELWPSLSVGQKANALASLTTPVLNYRMKSDIGSKEIPGSRKSPLGPLTAGQALALTGSGLNGHATARNWEQLSAFAAMTGQGKTPQQVAALGMRAGLLGFGGSGSAVRVNMDHFVNNNIRAASEFGIGAVKVPARAKMPDGYQAVARAPQGGMIALPKSLAHTSSLGKSPVDYHRAKMVAAGKHSAQKLWGKAPSRGISRGSAGGSALISGLGIMRQANPSLLGSVIAYSLFGNN